MLMNNLIVQEYKFDVRVIVRVRERVRVLFFVTISQK